MRFSDREQAAVSAAAGRAGMATAAWLGQTGLDAAEYRSVPVPAAHRELLDALAAFKAVMKQAQASLSAAGHNSGAASCATAARHADEVSLRLYRKLS